MYPPVSGLVIRVGRRLAFVPASAIDRIGHAEVILRSARLDLRDVVRRSGEVLLAKDVLDHQLVDVEGVQVIRAADLYLAEVIGRIRLVGADVSNATLLRRLGPRRWRPRPTPDRVIDWAAIQPFTDSAKDVSGAATRCASRRRTKDCTDCARVSWPTCWRISGATSVGSFWLRWPRRGRRRPRGDAARGPRAAPAGVGPRRGGRLLAAMEPDEAVDALRDLPLAVRAEVLRHIPAVTALALRELLGYEEDEAGGIMTTALVTAKSGDKVKKVVDRSPRRAPHGPTSMPWPSSTTTAGCSATCRCSTSCWRCVRRPKRGCRRSLGDEDVVTVSPHTSANEAAAQLVEARRHSMVVVDDDGRPIGRILADDVLDVLVPTKGRFHFPRLLS
jgi:CBS domain-containing protein